MLRVAESIVGGGGAWGWIGVWAGLLGGGVDGEELRGGLSYLQGIVLKYGTHLKSSR